VWQSPCRPVQSATREHPESVGAPTMRTLNLAPPPLACSLTPRVRCGGRAVPAAAIWQSELRVAPVLLRRNGGAVLLQAAGRRAAPLRTSPMACVAPGLAGVDSGA